MRTFILGAGFSYAIAKAPLMHQLWDFFEEAYHEEKSKNNSNIRTCLYEKLEKFINKIEESAKNRFKEKNNISSDVKQNLEYLITLMDIHSEYSANLNFNFSNADVTPYPVIPLPFTNQGHLKELKDAISTYLYIVLEKLKENELLHEFSSLIKKEDYFINFNYDLLLEKGLWSRQLWSPLEGYIGVKKFKYSSDYNDLMNANLNSKTYISKMHGSLMFSTEGLLPSNEIKIKLDNNEKWDFFFDELYNLLSREPEKLTGKTAAKSSEANKGKYQPNWIFPSFVKPFNSKNFYEIWKSAFNRISKTEELHIIGYSFRPEDTNGQLLLLNLPKASKVILVDPSQKVKQRVENIIGSSIDIYYKSLSDYIFDYSAPR